MIYYQMTNNAAVNKNLTHVIEIIPPNVDELTKSHIKINFLHDQ